MLPGLGVISSYQRRWLVRDIVAGVVLTTLLVPQGMAYAAVARLGFIADLISKPTMIGYMNGLALTILIGQLAKLFGFKVESSGFIGDLTGFIKGLADGEAVPAAAAVGIAGIVVILVLQRWLPKVPAVLVMVVATILGQRRAGERDGSVRHTVELPSAATGR